MIESEMRSLVNYLPVVACSVPFRLMLLKHLPLRVVSDVLDIDETAQIKLFGPELCHDAGWGRMSVCDCTACRRRSGKPHCDGNYPNSASPTPGSRCETCNQLQRHNCPSITASS